MSVVSQRDLSACSDEKHNVDFRDEIGAERDNENQDVDANANQYNPLAPTPRAAREDDQKNCERALVGENRSASVPITQTEETYIGTNRPFDLNSVLTVRTDHPSICTGDRVFPSDSPPAPPSASGKEATTHAIIQGGKTRSDENGFVAAPSATKEPALTIPILVDSDYFETNEDGDISSVASACMGKGVDRREHGNATYDPKSLIVPVDATSTGGSEFIELVGIHKDEGKSVHPEESENGMSKHQPDPSRIDFRNHQEIPFQKQGIPLQSFEVTRVTDVNQGIPSPRRWHPKISPYRLIVFSIPLAIATAKAVLSQKGSVTTPITLEWISGVIIFLILFLLGSYETCNDIPKYLLWLFKPDCVDFVWYLAAKLSIQRPEYSSNERDLESDPGDFFTSYRILVSSVVVLLGSLKTAFAYASFSTNAIWVEWLFAGLLSSSLYFVGLYESNSLDPWPFFREDRSPFLRPESVTPIPVIVGLAFFFVIHSSMVLPSVKRITPKHLEEYTREFQLPIGPILSKGTLEKVYLVVVIYIPVIMIFFFFLGSLIFCLRVPILNSTFMLPSGVRYHTGRFVGAVERFSQRRPIARIIHYFFAFGRLLLFVGWGIWFFLFVCFVVGMAKRNDFHPFNQIFFYPAVVMGLVYSGIIAASILGEKWWPSRDNLSHFIPPSIKNASMTKFIRRQVTALLHLALVAPSESYLSNSVPANYRSSSSGPSYSPLEILPSLTIYIIFGVFGSFIVHEIFKGMGGDGVLPLPVLVSLSTLASSWTLIICIYYLFSIILEFLRLCFSGLYRESTWFGWIV